MTAENSVQFKVYLVQNDAEPEIRRFSVSKDVVTSYIYLKQKLGVIFPSLKETPFIISWRDREGDQVQIWSDEELIIALTEMDGDSKKLFVSPSQPFFNPHIPSDGQFGGKAVHVGVTCDSCEKEVVGFRYKCAFCPDYDLCQDCEAKKMHSEHYMVRIPTPINRDMEFGKRMMKEFCKFNKHAMKDHEWKRGSFRHHKRPGSGHCPFAPPQPQHCASNSAPQGEQSTPQHRPFFEQGLPMNIEGILESVMQGLLRMAGAEVPEPPTKEKSSPQAPAQSETNPGPQTGVRFATPPSNASAQEPIQIPINLENNAQEVRSPEAVISLPSSSVSKQSSSSEMMEQEVVNPWNNLHKVSGHEQIQAPKSVQNDKEFLKAGGDMQAPIHFVPPSQPQMNIFAPVPTQNINPNQTNIEESLNRMLSMGFNNEGDFLRQVLISKNGDIEQVLDMLLPTRRSSN